jgi:hypothetical protein
VAKLSAEAAEAAGADSPATAEPGGGAGGAGAAASEEGSAAEVVMSNDTLCGRCALQRAGRGGAGAVQGVAQGLCWRVARDGDAWGQQGLRGAAMVVLGRCVAAGVG